MPLYVFYTMVQKSQKWPKTNGQTFLFVAMMQTVFFEMFLSVAHSNGVITFMQTFNGLSHFNQQKILHNRWISNMKVIRHTRSCSH